jgi:hypothetical protein
VWIQKLVAEELRDGWSLLRVPLQAAVQNVKESAVLRLRVLDRVVWAHNGLQLLERVEVLKGRLAKRQRVPRYV